MLVSAPSSFEHRFRQELPLLYKYFQEAPANKVQDTYCDAVIFVIISFWDNNLVLFMHTFTCYDEKIYLILV